MEVITKMSYETAEQEYTRLMEQLPPDVEGIIWDMMTIKAPLQNAFETGTRVLFIPARQEPRIEVMEDTDYKKFQGLLGGPFEGYSLGNGYSMYALDDVNWAEHRINRFIFKNTGLVVRGDVVIVRNDEEGNKIDYVFVDWKKVEYEFIRKRYMSHYISLCRNQFTEYLQALRKQGLIDEKGKRL